MPEFEFRFEIPAISEDVEDRIVERFDAVVAEHLGVHVLTLTAEGSDCVSSARHVIDTLANLGAPPRRLIDDLVGRTQIAERLAVSRQAVALWCSGNRQVKTEFPAPFVIAGGGMWRWAEVATFARAIGRPVDDIEYPSRRESQFIEGMIAARSFAAHGTLVTAMIERLAVTTSVEVTPVYSVQPQAEVRLTGYSLAA